MHTTVKEGRALYINPYCKGRQISKDNPGHTRRTRTKRRGPKHRKTENGDSFIHTTIHNDI